ncbi:MAG: glycoside hydrolase family 43 protein [Acidobacteriota bacterium]
MMKRWVFVALLLGISAVGLGQKTDADMFTNPVLPTGPDPWVFTWHGHYYFTATTGKNLTLWETADISDLADARKKVVWTPEPGKPWSRAIWAPELYRWGGKWYIYFAATDGAASGRRIFVVENAAEDPLDGSWTLKGQVSDATNQWAIDPDVFEVHGTYYMLWSGWPGGDRGVQNIYIARMKDPWTIDSPRTLLSTPTYDWEKHSERLHDGGQVLVNEGPEALLPGDRVFVTYSASGCWTDEYSLGLLSAPEDSDLLSAASWKKLDHPVFAENPAKGVYGPGHNGFFKSPDGKQDWIIYHANPGPNQGCAAMRSPRIQRFTWNSDGTPNFGAPDATGMPLAKPSR